MSGSMKKKQSSQMLDRTQQLVTLVDPRSVVSEMYHILSANLNFASIDDKVRSLVVTSSTPGEGKSTVSSNLAVVTAQAGKKTIIVDGDLRKPTVHRVFQVSNLIGVTNVLLKEFELSDAIQKSSIQHLDVLTSGPIPPNPADVVGSEAMRTLIASLTSQYELVIIDSPPILSVTDVRLLARAVDGLLFVVGSGIVKRQALTKAQEALQLSGTRILGSVINKKKLSKMEQKNYYYEYGENGSS